MPMRSPACVTQPERNTVPPYLERRWCGGAAEAAAVKASADVSAAGVVDARKQHVCKHGATPRCLLLIWLHWDQPGGQVLVEAAEYSRDVSQQKAIRYKPRLILCSTRAKIAGRAFTLMGLCCPQQQPLHGDSMCQAAVSSGSGPGKIHVRACAACMRFASSSQTSVRLYTSNTIGPSHPTSLKAEGSCVPTCLSPAC
jgi:hypothetical protein